MNEQSVCLVHIFWNELKAKNGESEREKKGERERERGITTTMTSNSRNSVVEASRKLNSLYFMQFSLSLLVPNDCEATAAVVLLQHDSFELNKMWMPTAKKLERICFAPFAALLFHSRSFCTFHAEEITSRFFSFFFFLIVWISESSRAPFKQL